MNLYIKKQHVDKDKLMGKLVRYLCPITFRTYFGLFVLFPCVISLSFHPVFARSLVPKSNSVATECGVNNYYNELERLRTSVQEIAHKWRSAENDDNGFIAGDFFSENVLQSKYNVFFIKGIFNEPISPKARGYQINCFGFAVAKAAFGLVISVPVNNQEVPHLKNKYIHFYVVPTSLDEFYARICGKDPSLSMDDVRARLKADSEKAQLCWAAFASLGGRIAYIKAKIAELEGTLSNLEKNLKEKDFTEQKRLILKAELSRKSNRVKKYRELLERLHNIEKPIDFMGIPPEIMIDVFKNLPQEDIKNIRKTSSFMKDLVEENFEIVRCELTKEKVLTVFNHVNNSKKFIHLTLDLNQCLSLDVDLTQLDCNKVRSLTLIGEVPKIMRFFNRSLYVGGSYFEHERPIFKTPGTVTFPKDVSKLCAFDIRKLDYGKVVDGSADACLFIMNRGTYATEPLRENRRSQ